MKVSLNKTFYYVELSITWEPLNDNYFVCYTGTKIVFLCVTRSGDSRIKKVGGKGHCRAKKKWGGQRKCLSCMVIFR